MNSNGCEEEQSSLDYIEDPYFNPQVTTSTPSLDDLDDVEYLDENDILENELELFDLRQLDFDDLNFNSLGSNGNDESVNVETEFFNVKRANAIIRAFFRKNFKKQVRVTYRDLTKPYLARLPKDNNFRKYLDISNGNAEDAMAAGDQLPPTTDLSHMTLEEKHKQEEEWRAELAVIEEDIATLRAVLSAKVRRSSELKRNLGITVWKELTEDVNQGIKNVKESNV
ncbi:tumor protein d52 [Holotrichia oblita]|uniref:Tumor protein d52 n=1 Tax=Holotrichia oblita TaxID=644536 RepID=A0ACB9TH94_HOLOL|nr:tumor protein d52 [Holotrichia oblita]